MFLEKGRRPAMGKGILDRIARSRSDRHLTPGQVFWWWLIQPRFSCVFCKVGLRNRQNSKILVLLRFLFSTYLVKHKFRYCCERILKMEWKSRVSWACNMEMTVWTKSNHISFKSREFFLAGVRISQRDRFLPAWRKKANMWPVLWGGKWLLKAENEPD